MSAWGRYNGRKKKKEKNIPRSRGHTTGTHNSNGAIYQPTYSSTAERSTTVTPTKRCTHPPYITAVQLKTYTQQYLSSRESGETMGLENKSTEHVRHPEPRTHSTIHVLTHQPTPPTHPPTQQPTDARTYPATMCYSNTAEYSRI